MDGVRAWRLHSICGEARPDGTPNQPPAVAVVHPNSTAHEVQIHQAPPTAQTSTIGPKDGPTVGTTAAPVSSSEANGGESATPSPAAPTLAVHAQPASPAAQAPEVSSAVSAHHTAVVGNGVPTVIINFNVFPNTDIPALADLVKDMLIDVLTPGVPGTLRPQPSTAGGVSGSQQEQLLPSAAAVSGTHRPQLSSAPRVPETQRPQLTSAPRFPETQRTQFSNTLSFAQPQQFSATPRMSDPKQHLSPDFSFSQPQKLTSSSRASQLKRPMPSLNASFSQRFSTTPRASESRRPKLSLGSSFSQSQWSLHSRPSLSHFDDPQPGCSKDLPPEEPLLISSDESNAGAAQPRDDALLFSEDDNLPAPSSQRGVAASTSLSSEADDKNKSLAKKMKSFFSMAADRYRKSDLKVRSDSSSAVSFKSSQPTKHAGKSQSKNLGKSSTATRANISSSSEEKMPAKKRRHNSGSDDDPHQGKCSICFVKKANMKLRCRHVYCEGCLKKLKANKKPCPNCGQTFRVWEKLFI